MKWRVLWQHQDADGVWTPAEVDYDELSSAQEAATIFEAHDDYRYVRVVEVVEEA